MPGVFRGNVSELGDVIDAKIAAVDHIQIE
jgi:hypothetical protein